MPEKRPRGRPMLEDGCPRIKTVRLSLTEEEHRHVRLHCVRNGIVTSDYLRTALFAQLEKDNDAIR